ncbi:MAG: dihydrodipicolinate synthase family protein [Planctomycetaceae bacterium]|nr:dihydrodipicolinate synthase family protein [Planctomycetaceae bacterium]
MFHLRGLIAATFTAMHDDGSLDLDRVSPMVERLLADGVAGLYVVGSTGEGPSLTSNERRDVAAAFVKAAAGRVPVIVQVGHNSLADAAELAAHAAEIGADAISATPPSYFRPESLDDLIGCIRRITEAAPRLPFYYYHIPMRTGVEVDLVEFLRRGHELPSLHGVKFTSPRVDQLQAAMRFAGERYDLLFGFDEMLLSAAAIGVKGAVGSTYNFAAPLYRRLLDAAGRGDLKTAARCQQRSVEMINVIVRQGGFAGQKAIMGLLGMPCGPPRLPLRSMPASASDSLRDELTEIGFFDWARDFTELSS